LGNLHAKTLKVPKLPPIYPK